MESRNETSKVQNTLAEFLDNSANLHPRRDLKKLQLMYRLGISLLSAGEKGELTGYSAALRVFDGLYDVLSHEIIHKGKFKKLWKTFGLYGNVLVGQRDATFGYYGIPDEEYLPIVNESLRYRHTLAFLRS